MSTTVSRLITSFQSTGRMGRSTLQQALISWFAFAGVEFSAIDCDSEHKTLSSWYPDIATFFPYRRDDDLLPILNLAGSGPVELIDFPAQATQSILNACHHFSALKIFADKGIRLTICIFASDERAALASGAQIVSTLGEDADYLIVCNPARFSSQVFFASKLAERLNSSGQIHIPRLTAGTIESVDRASKKKRKALTFREAEPLLEIGSRYELEHWRNRLFAQFEGNAATLLPDPDLIKNKVTRAEERSVEAINPFDL
jgi:hypothetical protein